MRIVPKSNARAILYFESQAPRWQEDPGAIGLTPEETAEVATLTAEARATYDAHLRALQAARSATLRYELAIERLRVAGAGCIARIRAVAMARGDERILAAAALPVPAKPSPLAAPGTPTNFEAQLAGNAGTIRLTWDCKNPAGSSGTVYEIRRNDQPVFSPPDFRFIAITGEKQFLDDTIPPGTPTVEYQVTAIRSRKRSGAGRHLVSFGAGRPVGEGGLALKVA